MPAASLEHIYLDNAATTRPFPEAARAVALALEAGYGNPSSRHILGLEAHRVVERARTAVARAVGAEPREVVFTGGGSEANNLALKGAAFAHARAGRHVVVSAVEHPSVLEAAGWLGETLGLDVSYVPVGRDGRVRAEDVVGAVTPETILVSLMHVNNEVGAVQPVTEVGRRLRAGRATTGRRKGLPLFHVDAVQSLGRLPVDVRAWEVDLLSVSAHKVHGPKGVGALFVRRGTRLAPLVHGGGQEAGLRSGTENVPGVAGFGAAVERLAGEGPQAIGSRLAALRRRLIELVREKTPAEAGAAGALGASGAPWAPGVVVNGPEDGSRAGAEGGAWAGPADGLVAPHILNLSFPGIPGEVLQHHLETRGVFVSTGSACSSRHAGRPSHVLEAMGCPAAVVSSAVRLSLSALTTNEEVERAGRTIAEVVGELRGLGEARR